VRASIASSLFLGLAAAAVAQNPVATQPAVPGAAAPPAAASVPAPAPAASGEDVDAERPGHSRHGGEFDEGPRRAAHSMPGLSDQVHFPVAGLAADAQAFFDQGICQQHGFWYFEAERSFRQVALLQPDCALAYWGMAMANVDNVARAAGFAAMAVQRAAGLPERERLYVDAIAGLYQIDDALRKELQSGDAARVAAAKATVVGKQERDEKKLRRAFVRALEAVVAAAPDDLEAKAFLAIQSWHNDEHGIPISSHGAVDALLDQVLAKAPRHPAHHYRVHLWDGEEPERALRSAAALGDSAPAIAHQWHMAGHTYAELHRHAEAAWQQEASGRVDHAHMARERVMPFLIHNYGHNQEWLARSLGHLGRGDQALAIAKNLAELPRHPKWNRPGERRDIAGYARARLVQVCEDHELWADAVALCRAGYLERSDDVKGEVQRLGLLGRALFRLGRLDEAQRVLADVDALLAKARAARAAAVDRAEGDAFAQKVDGKKTREVMEEAGREPTASVQSVLDLQRELRGEQLLAAGDAKGALAEFLAVKDFPKTLLADAHVAAGEPDKAVELLEKDVKDKPGRYATAGRLYLALMAKWPESEDERAKLPELRERWQALAMRLPPIPSGDEAWTPFQERVGIGADVRGPRGDVHDRAFGDDFGQRPPLESLGPRLWEPFANAGFDLPAANGATARVALPAAGNGRATLVVFYLGFGCLHCVQQLEALVPKADAFAAAGIDVVVIGDEELVRTQSQLAAYGKPMPFPLLADPELGAFKAWHCFDDFEQLALHGTFLVDGDGRVRWQDVSAEPFAEIDWLLVESRRLLALPPRQLAR
jgi:peroxiredoxin/tetratricopeptide (TPR) repeat protein